MLALNVAGWFISTDARNQFSEPVLSARETLSRLDAAFAENGPSPGFLKAAANIIDAGTVFSWSGASKRVPITENWILWSAAWLDPILLDAGLTDVADLFGAYQFLYYEPALERGFGICSQLAILTTDLLSKRYGIETRVIGLEGHVVAEATVAEGAFIIDSSLGVFLPFNLHDAERDLIRVRNSYGDRAEAKTYNAKGNHRYEPGTAGYRPKLYRAEMAAFVLKWLFPLSLLAAGGALFWRKRSRPKHSIIR